MLPGETLSGPVLLTVRSAITTSTVVVAVAELLAGLVSVVEVLTVAVLLITVPAATVEPSHQRTKTPAGFAGEGWFICRAKLVYFNSGERGVKTFSVIPSALTLTPQTER